MNLFFYYLILLILLQPIAAYGWSGIITMGGGSLTAGHNIGRTAKGGTQYNCSPTYAWAIKVQGIPSHNGILTEIVLSLDGNGTSRTIKACLYSDDAVNGMPGTMIVSSLSSAVAVNADADYTFTPVGSAAITENAQYWIVFQGADGVSSVDINYDSSTGKDVSYKTMTYDNFSAWGGIEDGSVTTWSVGRAYFVYSY